MTGVIKFQESPRKSPCYLIINITWRGVLFDVVVNKHSISLINIQQEVQLLYVIWFFY